jgi:hypothetical protein
MTSLQLQTISSEIKDRIQPRILNMSAFGAFSEFEKVSLNREIEKLSKVDRGSADLWRAVLVHTDGDFESALSHIENAKKLRHTKLSIDVAELSICCNLLYSTRALSIFSRMVSLENGNISSHLHMALSTGAFQLSKDLVAKAGSAVDLSGVAFLNEILEAADFLKTQNVTDEICAQILDVAGEVMREHNLFWMNLNPDIYVNVDEGFLKLDLRVDVTPKQASKMTLEMIDKLIEKSLLDFPFTVDFLGVKI